MEKITARNGLLVWVGHIDTAEDLQLWEAMTAINKIATGGEARRRKDNGNIEVFPVCDLYGAIRYNSKAEALEVAKVYEQIRGHKVLSVTMLEALQADLLAAEGAVKVFKEFIEKT